MSQPTTAYERNREPILKVLQQVLTPEIKNVFEIGSGSGHHATFLAKHFSWLQWKTSDMAPQLPLILATVKEVGVANVGEPIEFEVGKNELPQNIDAFFSANTLHIMSEPKVRILIRQLGEVCQRGAMVLLYGPFNYNGAYTSESNAAFDQWLKSVDPERGVRSFEMVNDSMIAAGFTLVHDYEMPSNNRLLQFAKRARKD